MYWLSLISKDIFLEVDVGSVNYRWMEGFCVVFLFLKLHGIRYSQLCYIYIYQDLNLLPLEFALLGAFQSVLILLENNMKN